MAYCRTFEIETLAPNKEQLTADIWWQPKFLSSVCASQLFEQLKKEIIWEQPQIRMFGKMVRIPRLQAWYGDDSATYQYSGLTNQPHPWTDTLLALKTELAAYLQQPLNSVLINLYRDGEDSMGWHRDNEKELGERPLIVSISLGTPRRFLLKNRKTDERIERLLTPGSLLVMEGDSQEIWLHSVPKMKRVLSSRINLTFRYIHP
ncbi:alpha-ketoglutarate-dependent dioxygenase AlkB family protein [Algicola sagamiensis]|uniref:alpha-ketoglutarate-dependent dioxygenase AlkB family protein n=1 Tax=Algicola sagamiensis TaxID=163869 RepID=UPI000380F8EF|nr:alpha-ketoglutarate-dependent dioxygenase AlkB [Algicola sagamiensis]